MNNKIFILNMYTMKKNKYTIVVFLGILVALLLFILFFSFKEGLANDCETYKSLGPVGKSDDEIKRGMYKPMYQPKFLEVINKNLIAIGAKATVTPADYQKRSKENLTVLEIGTFIDRGKFPLNKYIVSELRNNKNINYFGNKLNKDNLDKVFGNREIFEYFIFPTYSKKQGEDLRIYNDAFAVFKGAIPECRPVTASASASDSASDSASASATDSATKTGNTPIITNQAGGFVTISAEDAKTWDAACKTLR